MYALLISLALICAYASTLALAYTNPILWNDLADLDVSRVNTTYYYSASSMHFSPGAPILQSQDLVNWEYIGHSVPRLDWGSDYDLTTGRVYRQGVWASWLKYRASQDTWYWGGCVDFWISYVYSAPSVTGEWTRRASIQKCYYDSGLLIDDDDTMYISYISDNNIWVAQFSDDGTEEVTSQQVFAPPTDIGYLEGTRPYKYDGRYYILATKPGAGTYMLQADSIFGNYTIKTLVLNVPQEGNKAGSVHQGSLVDTPEGDWYYMGFIDAYPGGRIPVMAPITWGEDGFPVAQLDNGAFATAYEDPVPQVPTPSLTGTETFDTLGPRWEWNHNPDTSAYSVGDGLTLNTVTVTTDLYSARNTLTTRILGPESTATIELNYDNMAPGDRAGLVLLRDHSGYVGVQNDGGSFTVVMVTDIDMDENWDTASNGTVVETVPISGGTVWLRLYADITPQGGQAPNVARFSYSTDGSAFTSIGEDFTMVTGWEFFMGYRFGIFNYATSDLGGSIHIPSFTLNAGAV
ncbi:glycosyl hydrolase [Schizophyllum commune]